MYSLALNMCAITNYYTSLFINVDADDRALSAGRLGLLAEKEEPDTDTIQPLHDVERVVYNRVPKCGSEAVRDIIRVMARKHKYNIEMSTNYLQYVISKQEEVRQFIVMFKIT